VLTTSPSWANKAQTTELPGRFHLWHDIRDVFTLAWGGARTAFTLPTLFLSLPVAATIGGASFADGEVQAAFDENDADDSLVRAGNMYARVYFGAAQVGLYLAGELSQDPRLSATGKKTLASLLNTAALIQPLKFLTRRRRPDGSDLRSFPSFDAGMVSSIIPSLYAEYGVFPAVFAAVSAAFIGFTRIYGNKHYLSDVLTSYAIGVGWGIMVEAYARHQPAWALVPTGDGRTTVGLALHLRL
jgi:membrane-associated phospholipid phosphatase